MPIGDIVTSLLPYPLFRHVVFDPVAWEPARCRWAPADGRVVDGSEYARLLGGEGVRVPDLRGMFLRGLNQFDPQEPNPAPADTRDPDGARTVGSVQMDAFADHRHRLVTQPGAGERGIAWGIQAGNKGLMGGHHARATEEVGGPETRPRNVAVYYYVRINEHALV
jgi:hypothetical protein